MVDQRQDQDKKPKKSEVQGEGNYEAARRYREEVATFIDTADIEDAANKAKDARESAEREDLEKAEKAGKAKAKGVDPQAKRN